MKMLLIACLALSAAAFADSTVSSKTSTTKEIVAPSESGVYRTGTVHDTKTEVKKMKTQSRQRMEDPKHMKTYEDKRIKRTTTEEEED